MIANTSARFWRAIVVVVLLVYVPASEARSARIEEAKFVPTGGIEQ